MTDHIQSALDRLSQYCVTYPEHDSDDILRRAKEELASIIAQQESVSEKLNLTELLSPTGGYEKAKNEDEIKRSDAQLVDEEWYVPVNGCDSLNATLDRIAERLRFAARRPPFASTRQILLTAWEVWGENREPDRVRDFARKLLARFGGAFPPISDDEIQPPRRLPAGYVGPMVQGEEKRAILTTFYQACLSEDGDTDEVTLRGLLAVIDKHGKPELTECKEDVELAASWIYSEAMAWAVEKARQVPGDKVPEWITGGNSGAQDVARAVARAILYRQRLKAATAPSGGLSRGEGS